MTRAVADMHRVLWQKEFHSICKQQERRGEAPARRKALDSDYFFPEKNGPVADNQVQVSVWRSGLMANCRQKYLRGGGDLAWLEDESGA